MALDQKELQAEFSAYAENRPKISTHSHQLPGRELRAFDLEALLRNSYVNWCGVTWDISPQSRQDFLSKVRFNSFFIWLQESLVQLYGDSTPLTVSTWQSWSDRIQAAYLDPSHPRRVLTGRCGYRRMLLDAYWNPGSDNDSLEFFAPVYRVNSFFFGYSAVARDHDGNNPYDLYPRTFITDLDEYVDWIRQNILSRQSAGCVALKIPIAYDRGLDFESVPADQASRAFARLAAPVAGEPIQTDRSGSDRSIPSNLPTVRFQDQHADPGDVKAFQDFLFFQICRLAAELDLPVQIHTGMGQGRKTNAAHLQQAIQSFPTTRFVLLHCSYPWVQDISLLVDKYPNVYPDLSMLPLVSTRAGKAMLHDLIERATLDRIFWGCDTWTAEESFGALLAFRHVLAATLAEKVLDGYFSRQDGLLIIDSILFNNPQRLYKLVSAA
jgi:uncharacterized protein